MKKHVFLLFIIMFSFFFELSASHYMGGEITWQCLANGRYRFVMKLYRECNGVTYGNTEILNTNVPGFPSIQMNLFPGGNPNDGLDGTIDGKTDLSPNCWSSLYEIHCTPNPSVPNTGAVEEWYYTTDAVYPAGVPLAGLPPATGYIFSYTSCCRNPSNNIVGATNDSWFLRAVMYPSHNQNIAPCYDNSPVFAESPQTITNAGLPFLGLQNTNDVENDSLTYSWSPALNGNLNTIVTYQSPYTFGSPLPGLADNSQNIPAYLNPITGELSFTSFTVGPYALVVKVSEWHDGVLIGEIYREWTINIVNSSSLNNLPTIDLVYGTTDTTNNISIDTVDVGNIVQFTISALDLDTLPNSLPQTISLAAYGDDFGQGFINNTSGCLNPPCATLNPPPPNYNQFALSTNFNWQTSNNHLVNLTYDGIYAYSTHNFYFYFSDNWCPVSGTAYRKAVVVIRIPYLIIPNPPNLQCVSVDSSNRNHLTWIPPTANSSMVSRYLIFRSDNFSVWNLIDSVYGYSTNTYTDPTVFSPSDIVAYRVSTKTDSSVVSIMSQAIRKIVPAITQYIANSYISLAWNLPSNNYTGKFYIYRAINSGSFSLIDSTYNLNYTDIFAMPISDTCYYKILTEEDMNIVNPNDRCTSWSAICSTAGMSDIANVSEDELVKIYPNPANEKLQIYLNTNRAKDFTLSIFNGQGKEMYHAAIDSYENEMIFEIPVHDFANGLYYIRVKTSDQFFSKKIMIVH